MHASIAIVMVLMATPATSFAQAKTTLPPTVQAAFSTARIPLEAVAVVIEKLDEPRAGQRLVSENTGQPMNPASVMKLFTTGAALDLLGPASTWRNEFRASSPPVEGELKGALYFKGSGDPKLSMEQFWLLLRQLRLKGVRDIRGDLILDRSLFALPAHDPGAFDGEKFRPYNVGADAALINFNALRFLVTPAPGGKQAALLLETPDAQLKINARLHLTQGECGDWRERLTVTSTANALEVVGGFPASCGEKRLNLSPLSADAQIEGLFRALWSELGGTFHGKVSSGSTPSNSVLLALQESPPLFEAVRDINKFSNNVMARQLFLSLSAGTPPASYDKSAARVREWLQSRGIAAPELVIENGSGLSRRDRSSADTLAALLRSVWKSPTMPELMSSLPILGEDGTLKKRGNGLKGRAHLKTGYIEGVRALAGYVLDRRGERWLLVAIINHPNALQGKEGLDLLVGGVINPESITVPAKGK